MAGSEQDQVMDAKLISERHVIERYLAGQLTDAEADAFERALETHPELARDVERVARMKTGFEVLARRGELAKLLAQPVAPPKRRAVWVAAAAAVVLALGILAFRHSGTPAPATLLAVSLDALSSRSDSPIPLRASVALARARGMGADAELTASLDAPGAAELELSTGAAAGTHYAIELLAVDSTGARVVAKVPDTATDASGAVHVFVSLHALPAGPYLLRMSPADAGAPIEYSIALRPSR
jgi:anti-sigma factor RsiW